MCLAATWYLYFWLFVLYFCISFIRFYMVTRTDGLSFKYTHRIQKAVETSLLLLISFAWYCMDTQKCSTTLVYTLSSLLHTLISIAISMPIRRQSVRNSNNNFDFTFNAWPSSPSCCCCCCCCWSFLYRAYLRSGTDSLH